MIRHDSEYHLALQRVDAERTRLAEVEAKMTLMGMSEEEVKLALEPLITFRLQLEEEIARYKRLKAGDFSDFVDIRHLGACLIAARIAHGTSQRELAKLLNVDESQVSRDERNEYHGISLSRAIKIAEVLGLEVGINCESTVKAKEPTKSCHRGSFISSFNQNMLTTRVSVTRSASQPPSQTDPRNPRFAA